MLGAEVDHEPVVGAHGATGAPAFLAVAADNVLGGTAAARARSGERPARSVERCRGALLGQAVHAQLVDGPEESDLAGLHDLDEASVGGGQADGEGFLAWIAA